MAMLTLLLLCSMVPLLRASSGILCPEGFTVQLDLTAVATIICVLKEYVRLPQRILAACKVYNVATYNKSMHV